ncbi:MAG: hypothetical protein ACI39U_04515 [Candidatus Cryptobacteroides sp.]
MVKNQFYDSPRLRTFSCPVEAAVALSQTTQKNSFYEINYGGQDDEFA